MPSGLSRRSAAATVAAVALHEAHEAHGDPHHDDGKGAPHQPVTLSEYATALGRITSGAMDGLTFTHLPPIAAGATALFAVGVRESRLWLRPSSHASAWYIRYGFMVRYGMAQLVPSLIPQTQPAAILARRSGLPTQALFDGGDVLRAERPERYLRYIRSVAFRCAIAGSILLSQVVSLVNILMDAQEDYVENIWQGKEPPLDVSRTSWFDSTDHSSGIVHRLLHGTGHQQCPGVVVRLAGETSDVTTQSLAVEGARRIFPIFENPALHNVETAVRTHGGGGQGGDPLVPVYWRVANGRYGRADSWRDLKIPRSWLHDVTPTASRVRMGRPNKMLLLEADATSGDAASLSLGRKCSSDLDLDLYEVEQGFYHLECCVDAPPGEFETMRVLLVDPETSVEKGGGFSQIADEYVRDLDLADVVIDARRPLIIAMARWLESVDADNTSCDGRHGSRWGILKRVGEKLARLVGRKSPRPVILWTPKDSWFQSIRQELAPLDYNVISYTEALRQYGREGAEHLPMFVYEKSISDSVHTTSRLVEKGRTCKDTVCALFPQHFNSNRGEEEHRYASICSTSLYNQLFRWVRERALEGRSADEIQARLDDDLEGILAELVEAGKLAQGQEWVRRAALQRETR